VNCRTVYAFVGLWCGTFDAFAAPSEPPAPTTQEAVSRSKYPRSPHQLFVNLGFSHWYGQTFGAPIGVSTPALIVGVRPGVRFLEVRLHYTLSLRRLELPTNGERSRIGFGNLDLQLSHELRLGGQRMVMGFGPSAGFVHTSQGVGFSVGAVLSARYLIDIADVVATGPFLDVRAQLYHLPGSDVPFFEFVDGGLNAGHSDLQLQLGVALSFW
jgi:hypothetical protein